MRNVLFIQDYTRTYNRNGEKTTEDVHKDKDDQTELILKKNDDGHIEMITGIDYRRVRNCPEYRVS